jgi:hypothetical protein
MIDGWYVLAPGFPKWKGGGGGSFTILVTSSRQSQAVPQIRFKQTGPSPEGFPVWQKTSSSVDLPGASRHTSEHVIEVTELVEGNLPDSLFQPPDGYQRVASVPFTVSPDRAVTHAWGELLQAHAKMFEDWLNSLFGTHPNR